MRLDHLLSKENRVFVLSLCGCWLVPGGGKFLFSGEDRYRIYFMCCVWFGISETRMSVFVFRFCLMVCFVLWHAVGYLGQHECCSMDHPW